VDDIPSTRRYALRLGYYQYYNLNSSYINFFGAIVGVLVFVNIGVHLTLEARLLQKSKKIKKVKRVKKSKWLFSILSMNLFGNTCLD